MCLYFTVGLRFIQLFRLESIRFRLKTHYISSGKYVLIDITICKTSLEQIIDMFFNWISANFSPLVLSVGIIISGVVFIIGSTIVIILCLKRKKNFSDNTCYENDVKKGQVMTTGSHLSANGKHHNLAIDSGSSGADSDMKVEMRTASSMSQHWPEDTDQRCADPSLNTDMAQVVENIYSYTTNPSQSILFTTIRNVILIFC